MHLMVDIETLGNTPGCGILTIAVVPFCTSSPFETFYERVYPPSNTVAGLTIDDKTMDWWTGQPSSVYDEAFGGEVTISVVLYKLAEYVKQFPAGTPIWGNGADFDIPILNAAYAAFKQIPPWGFRDSRCFRTLKNLFPALTEDVKVEMGEKHNALADAKYQAAVAEVILKRLTWR